MSAFVTVFRLHAQRQTSPKSVGISCIEASLAMLRVRQLLPLVDLIPARNGPWSDPAPRLFIIQTTCGKRWESLCSMASGHIRASTLPTHRMLLRSEDFQAHAHAKEIV